MTSWSVEHAWRCERHGWNTCPLTPATLRFSTEPCCSDAVPVATRSIAIATQRSADRAEPVDTDDGRSAPALG